MLAIWEGAPDLTVLMPVLAYTENNNVSVCIGLYWCLECIGLYLIVFGSYW